MSIHRRALLGALAAAAAVASTQAGAADAYPSRPITIVVPFSAGGGVDTMARLLADKLRTTLGTSVVVDNKAGGSGMIGAMAVVKAQPDGYTLLMGSAGETAINPFVYKGRMQYDPARDLAPITLVTRVPNVLVASPTLPVKTMEELVAYGRKNPGKLTYSSSGVGNPQHLNGELLEELAGMHMVHVPYKGASGQLIDVTTGQVDLTFVSYTAAKSFIQAGKVKALAVTSAKRTSFAPDLPAIAEYKPLARYQLENWFGLWAPAATPADVQQKLNTAVTQALADPELVKKLREQGGEPAAMPIAQFRDFIKAESAQFARIVETARITAE
ncbi:MULTISPECIES: Bug family tripartite tricarboxylate transporter substrate binding protein [Ramlibacter]|uniref:Tripartite tricarboxylate transporter substrate binding protein n=1 Tax=Ramlibacter pinisoli TaxID=2682844 RepID=A0A6N8IVZ1_9BURK|nr:MULTISPECIES: tripartite tricarboxylate transporter substrate binding protein [Ramlibacter]MBA2961052.1 tripartite tricarboxylate transporter substrate binding protein [Ramlibacter sp. CGMCC 1.13660]MVQ30997.1 tripartite tricarboxylate transporter substrate binding protein [Ramlibacter pinisoli]